MSRIKLAVALAALAAVLALPAGAADSPGPAPAGVERSVTVTGSGTARAVPDRSRWSFGVQARGDTASATLRSVSTQMAKLLAALRGAGVAKADLQTQNVSLGVRENEDGTKIVGYSASQSVSATLKSLATAGAIVDAAVEAGATDVNGPDLSPSSTAALEEQALQAAFDDAQAKARALAEKAGATLGRAVTIAEQGATPLPALGAAKASVTGAMPVPIEPGESELQASVTVTFAIS
jgi:uncharacterized protein YggE